MNSNSEASEVCAGLLCGIKELILILCAAIFLLVMVGVIVIRCLTRPKKEHGEDTHQTFSSEKRLSTNISMLELKKGNDIQISNTSVLETSNIENVNPIIISILEERKNEAKNILELKDPYKYASTHEQKGLAKASKSNSKAILQGEVFNGQQQVDQSNNLYKIQALSQINQVLSPSFGVGKKPLEKKHEDDKCDVEEVESGKDELNIFSGHMVFNDLFYQSQDGQETVRVVSELDSPPASTLRETDSVVIH